MGLPVTTRSPNAAPTAPRSKLPGEIASVGTVRLKFHLSRQSADVTSLLNSPQANTELENWSVVFDPASTTSPVASPEMGSASGGSAGQAAGADGVGGAPVEAPTIHGTRQSQAKARIESPRIASGTLRRSGTAGRASAASLHGARAGLRSVVRACAGGAAAIRFPQGAGGVVLTGCCASEPRIICGGRCSARHASATSTRRSRNIGTNRRIVVESAGKTSASAHLRLLRDGEARGAIVGLVALARRRESFDAPEGV